MVADYNLTGEMPHGTGDTQYSGAVDQFTGGHPYIHSTGATPVDNGLI